MENVIANLPKLPKVRVKLSVPLIANMYNKGYKCTEIAKLTGYSHQRISQFTAQHYDHMIVLLDNSDVISALQSKYLATKFRDKLDDIVNSSEAFTKRDLIPCIAGADQMTKQYLSLSGKSPQNVTINQVNVNIEELEQRKREVLERIKKLPSS